MNNKTQAFFAVSLTAILALSAISVMTLQDAEATENHWKFKKKVDFTAELVIVNDDAAPDGAAATAKFWLDKHGEALKYIISIENMDVSGYDETDDDVTKLHLHEGTGDAHVLNVYKGPGQDDDDLVVKPTKGIIEGIWDDSDENLTYDDHHDNSQTLTSQLGELCNGNLFTMIHGKDEVGALKGFIEPTNQGDKICNQLGY